LVIGEVLEVDAGEIEESAFVVGSEFAVVLGLLEGQAWWGERLTL